MKSLYPRRPAHVPQNYTRPTSRYRWQVLLLLLTLLLSLVLYLAMLTGTAWLCFWLVADLTRPMPPHGQDGFNLLRILGILGSGLLFLYLLKGLFKRSRTDLSLLYEIHEEDQPELFEFIHRICEETGAPLPHRIYLSPEVNAAVFYQSSLLNLVLPTRKHLLIGLGLVEMLNLSEFKAVLAHEFGHFSQKSMKVGSYVYVANKVLTDIVYGRDVFDNALHQMKYLDLRLAVFVWMFLGVLWCLRKVLEGVFLAIHVLQLSLMRQMEFNADRVAASVAGSDAMVHALLRSGFADQAFQQLSNDLWTAADHNLYSRDIFRHLRPAGELLRRRTKDPNLGLPPDELGADVEVFQGSEKELGIPAMWSTHPSNHEREDNVKRRYVAAEIDERSPWALFCEPGDVRFEVSWRYYKVAHKMAREPRFSDPRKVQAFLLDEYAETTYAEHYHGFYDNRYLEIDDLDALLSQARRQKAPVQATLRQLRETFGPELQKWLKGHRQRLGEIDLLSGLQSGLVQHKNKSVEFRGRDYALTAMPKLLERVTRELEADQTYKAEIDTEIFVAHYRLADAVDRALGDDLLDRYEFHLGIQKMHGQVVQATQRAQAALVFASSQRQLSPADFDAVCDLLQEGVRNLYNVYRKSKNYCIPSLRNMEAGERLREFLFQQPVVEDLTVSQTSIDPSWIQDFVKQLAEVQDRLKRLLFKSLGGILATQEHIQSVHASAGDGG